MISGSGKGRYFAKLVLWNERVMAESWWVIENEGASCLRVEEGGILCKIELWNENRVGGIMINMIMMQMNGESAWGARMRAEWRGMTLVICVCIACGLLWVMEGGRMWALNGVGRRGRASEPRRKQGRTRGGKASRRAKEEHSTCRAPCVGLLPYVSRIPSYLEEGKEESGVEGYQRCTRSRRSGDKGDTWVVWFGESRVHRWACPPPRRSILPNVLH